MSMISGSDLRALGQEVFIFEVEGTIPGTTGKQAAKFKTNAELYADGHIPGASFLELAKLAEPGAPFANTRPTSATALAGILGQLGLSSTADRIVLYTRRPQHPKAHAGVGVMWTTRIWWVLQSWGFENVSILDGCVHTAWEGELKAGVETYPAKTFDQSSLVDHSELKVETAEIAAVAATSAKDIELLDSLPNWPNTGERYGRSGHITGAISADFYGVTDKESGAFTIKTVDEIKAYFSSRFDPSKPLIAY